MLCKAEAQKIKNPSFQKEVHCKDDRNIRRHLKKLWIISQRWDLVGMLCKADAQKIKNPSFQKEVHCKDDRNSRSHFNWLWIIS